MTDTTTLPVFARYRRKAIAEMRPWCAGDDMTRVSVSASDREAGSPKGGDMIARNPKNHDDQWLVASAYFADNFEALPSAEPTGWRDIATAPKADETGNDDRLIVSDGKEVCTAEFTNGRWIVSPTAWEGDGDRGGLADCPFEPTHWMPLPAAPSPTTGPVAKPK